MRPILSRFAIAIPVFAALVSGGGFAEDALPKELLLQCEGKLTVIMLGSKPTLYNANLRKMLRLKDGVMIDSETNLAYGKNCALLNGSIIQCELNGITYSGGLNSTEKRHSMAILSRSTGELKIGIEMQNFSGRQASGTPSSRETWSFTGVCRPTGGRLF